MLARMPDRAVILATLTYRLSNTRMEAAHTTIRLIAGRAYTARTR
jgi:hypothetical protein